MPIPQKSNTNQQDRQLKQNKAKIINNKKSSNTDDYVFKRYKYEQNKIFKNQTNNKDFHKNEYQQSGKCPEKQLENYKQQLKNENMDIFQFDQQDDEIEDSEAIQNQQHISDIDENTENKSISIFQNDLQNQSAANQSPFNIQPMELVDFGDDEDEQQDESQKCKNLQNFNQKKSQIDSNNSSSLQQQDSKIEFANHNASRGSSTQQFCISPASPTLSLNQSLNHSQLQDSACLIFKKKVPEHYSKEQKQQQLLKKDYKITYLSSNDNPFLEEEEEQIEEELKGVKIHSTPFQQDVSIQILDKQLFVSSKLPPGIILKCKLKRSTNFFNLMNPQFDLYLQNGLKHLVSIKKNSFRNRQLFQFSTKIGKFDHPIRSLMANVLHNTYWLVGEPKTIGKRKISYLDCLVEYSPLVENKKQQKVRGMRVLVPPTLKSYHIGLQYESPHIDFQWFKKNISLQLTNNLKGGKCDLSQNSIKNFVLVDDEDADYFYLKMEKQSDNVFDIEIQHPLTPLQAISIIMTRFDVQLK